MTITELLDSLPEPERNRTLGRIEGLQLAQRIARNRAASLEESIAEVKLAAGTTTAHAWRQEAMNLEGLLRLIQVQIGNGSMPFGDLTPEELDAIWRIY